MCGRYLFSKAQSASLLQLFRSLGCAYDPNAWPDGEITPGMDAPVLLRGREGIRAALLRWGYPVPNGLVINARAETAAEKPMFRDGVASHRCILPASGFFEWDAEKHKYLFTLSSADVLFLAGLYTLRNGHPYCCILTTAANTSMREVHDRMPLILPPEHLTSWLNDRTAAAELLRLTPPALEKASADAQLRLW